MSNFKPGMEAFITSNPYASNINKAVKLVQWVPPNESYGNDAVKFAGGECGGWVVRPVNTKVMLCTVGGNMVMISNVAFIRENELVETPLFESNEVELTAEQLADMQVYLLDDDAFDNFTKQLEDNPMSENKTLNELLSRPKPW